jgi:hypothetical protein
MDGVGVGGGEHGGGRSAAGGVLGADDGVG